MKSYFTRLAARARTANTPTLPFPNTSQAPDSFEPPAFSRSSPAPLAAKDPSASNTINEVTEMRPPAPAKSDHRPTSKRSALPSVPELEPSTAVLPEPAPTISADRHPAVAQQQHQTASPGMAHLQKNDSPDQAGPYRDASPTLQPRGLLSPNHPARKMGEPPAQTQTVEVDSVPDSVAEPRSESITLQQKADVFMAQIFEPQVRSESSQKVAADHQSEQIMNRIAEPASVQGMQPTKPIERRLKPEADPPSVSIGRLIIEVVPAVPTPVSQKSISAPHVTRADRNEIPSSRRFGLSQF